MKDRKYILLSLLLTGAVSASGIGGVSVRANEYVIVPEQYNELISDNETQLFDDENVEISISNNEELTEISSNEMTVTNISENDLISQNNIETTILSENEIQDIEDGEKNSISKNQSANEVVDEKPLNIVFPAEIPFNVVLTEDDGTKGLIYSKRFCIENRGDEDVCISVKGVCEGENQDDYVISKSSVAEEIVQNKKNVWIYMQWENENGVALDHSRVVMGHTSDSEKEEIILKSPKRDDNGGIIGDNTESRIYFSIFGELNSDLPASWKNDELKINLDLSMEAMGAGDIKSVSVNRDAVVEAEYGEELEPSDENNKDLEQADIEEELEDIKNEADETGSNSDLETVSGNISDNKTLDISTNNISENDEMDNAHNDTDKNEVE